MAWFAIFRDGSSFWLLPTPKVIGHSAQHHQTDQSISSPVSWRPLTNDTVWVGGKPINLINTLQHHAVAAILAFLDAP